MKPTRIQLAAHIAFALIFLATLSPCRVALADDGTAPVIILSDPIPVFPGNPAAPQALTVSGPDVMRFFLVKGQEYSQTNATNIISPAASKPFRFTADVDATATDSLLAASVKLPAGLLRTLTNYDGAWQFEAAFSNKAALDAGYPAGSYVFTMVGQHDGTNRPAFALPADNYPVIPKVLNWDDLQSVEASQALNFSWNTFTNGTTNDMILLELDDTNGATVAATPDLLTPDALNGTNRAAQLPAFTLTDNTKYEGRLLFLKRTSLTTNYPGAKGAAGYFRETKFPVATLPPAPANGRIQFASANYSASESSGAANIVVTRVGSSGAVSVDIHSQDGTARAGTDYFPVTGPIFFGDGETSKTVPLTLRDDFLLNSNRTVNLSLTFPLGGAVLGNRTNAVLSILDDEVAAAGQFQFASGSNSVAETAKSLALIISRLGGSSGTTTVQFAAIAASDVGDTAVNGLDYFPTNGTLVFPPNVTSRTITVPILNNTLAGSNATFHALLMNPTGGAALGNFKTTKITILNDDFGGTLAFKQTSYVTNETSTNFLVTIVRTGGVASGVTVDYKTVDGSAQAWQRYAPTNGTLSFNTNELSKTISIPVINNSLPDGDQFFFVQLTNVTGGATIATNKGIATLTVLDDESSVAFSNTTFTVSEDVGKITATVVRTGQTRTPTAVNFATADGSALAGVDYRMTNGVLAFPPGVKSKTFSVTILDNSILDGDRAFQLHLFNPTNNVELGLQNTATVTVTNNDVAGTIQFANYQFAAAENAKNAIVTIVRTGGLASGVAVDFNTDNGDAMAGENYSNATQRVTFGAGETSKQVLVPLIDDNQVNGDRNALLSLRNPSAGASLGDLTDVPLFIVNDDLAGTFSVARATYSAREDASNFVVNVIRTGGKGGGATVDFLTADGSALADVNYVGTGGTLTFAAGETNQTITVGILNDHVATGLQSFHLNLLNPGYSASLGITNSAELIIVDDLPSFCISNAAVSVSEAAGNAFITVVRTGPLTNKAAIRFATTNITAGAGSRYVATNGTLLFATNVATRTVAVRLLNDSTVNGDAQFNFAIFNPSNGVPLGVITNQIVTIVDDDYAGTVQFATNNFYGMEGTNAVVTLTRSGGLAGGVSVFVFMNGGTATPVLDYTNRSGTITFAPGQTSTNLLVPIVLDPLVETNETIGLSLLAPQGGLLIGTPGTATLNITDKHDPDGIPEAGPAFITATLNGTNITGLTLSGTNYFDLAGSGLDSYLSFAGTRNVINGPTNTLNAFTFANLVVNSPSILNFPGNSADNGVVSYQRYDVSFTGGPIINAASSVAGAGGKVTIDVLNRATHTATGRFDLNVVDGLLHQTYHLTGSFRVRW